MAEPAVETKETKGTYVPCTNTKILNMIRDAAALFDTKPMDIYMLVVEGASESTAPSEDANLRLVDDKWGLYIDAEITNPLLFSFYVSVAYFKLTQQSPDTKITLVDSIHLACNTLMKKAPPEWIITLINALRAYIDDSCSNYALTILRFLAAHGHDVEVVLTRHKNTSQDYAYLIYITGIDNYIGVVLRTVEAPLTFNEAVLAKAQELIAYCAEPNFSVRLDLGAKLHKAALTAKDVATCRRSL